MQITVLGASGRTGRLIIDLALNDGYSIKALVRTLSKLNIQHERLQLIIGDATNYEKIDESVSGSQAVISVLGHAKKSQPDIQTVALHHVITAMTKYEINRIISLTGTGVYHEGDKPRIIDRVSRFLLKLILKNRFLDGENHVKVILQNNFQWTIVRVPLLTNGPFTGKFRVGLTGVNSGLKISRADAAMFILQLVSENHYIHQMPVISY